MLRQILVEFKSKKKYKGRISFYLLSSMPSVSRNSFNEYLISTAAVCLHYLQEHQQHHKKALPFCPPMIPDDRQSKDENDEEVEEIIRDDTNRPQPNQSPDINQDRNILYQISQDEVRLICKFVNNVRISFIHTKKKLTTDCNFFFGVDFIISKMGNIFFNSENTMGNTYY